MKEEILTPEGRALLVCSKHMYGVCGEFAPSEGMTHRFHEIVKEYPKAVDSVIDAMDVDDLDNKLWFSTLAFELCNPRKMGDKFFAPLLEKAVASAYAGELWQSRTVIDWLCQFVGYGNRYECSVAGRKVVSSTNVTNTFVNKRGFVETSFTDRAAPVWSAASLEDSTHGREYGLAVVKALPAKAFLDFYAKDLCKQILVMANSCGYRFGYDPDTASTLCRESIHKQATAFANKISGPMIRNLTAFHFGWHSPLNNSHMDLSIKHSRKTLKYIENVFPERRLGHTVKKGLWSLCPRIVCHPDH